MLRVWADGRPVGYLDAKTRYGTTFSYDAGVDPADAVSLTMPVRTASYDQAHGMVPIFDMNLPEGALRLRLEIEARKALGTATDLDILSIVGHSQIGRVRLTAPDAALNEEVPFTSLIRLLSANREGGLIDEVMDTYARHSGIAGVQPKVLLRGEEDDGVRKSISVVGATHIMKFWDEYPELAANEFFCMSVARSAGLETPDFMLADDGACLLVERFDMQEGRYVGFEDFCVLNAARAEDKYKGGYETKLFRRISDFLQPSERAKALEQAFRMLVLSVMVRNGDAHLKNFGILYDDANHPRLAPTYDIITTTAYKPKDQMALTLDGSTRWPDRKKLTQIGIARVGIKQRDVDQIIEQTAEAIEEIAPEADRWFSQSSAPEIGERMLNAWREGIESLAPKRSVSFAAAAIATP